MVRQLHRTLIVERSPLETLAGSIKCIGSDLKGAIATAKWILGHIPMWPILVDPFHNICIFPTKTTKNDEAILVKSKSYYKIQDPK
ncbi:competence protein ComK [Neobacillus mesonae]|uniref:competence protein ComK n=1 Tax=Neobacillus mesonae TaxID=1193713 RepID=UPI0033057289